MALAPSLALSLAWPGVQAVAQTSFCADPAGFCGRTVERGCLTTLGAGAIPVDDGTTGGAGCKDQMAAYRDCLSLVASQCAGAPTSPQRAAPQADMLAVWSEVKDSADPDVLQAFAETYPGTPLATLALKQAAALRAGAPAAADAKAPVEAAAAGRPRIGVRVQSVTQEIAESLGLPSAEGALVTDVDENGPAGDTLRAGDVITAIGGRKIVEVRELTSAVAAQTPGAAVPIEYFRDRAAMSGSIAIGGQATASASAWDGLRTRDATPSGPELEAPDIGVTLRNTAGGAIVVGVDPAKSAAAAGLAEGDLILAVGANKALSAPAATKLIDLAKAAERRSVLLLVSRDGEQRYIAPELGGR